MVLDGGTLGVGRSCERFDLGNVWCGMDIFADSGEVLLKFGINEGAKEVIYFSSYNFANVTALNNVAGH